MGEPTGRKAATKRGEDRDENLGEDRDEKSG
jgi:hypothetical protein